MAGRRKGSNRKWLLYSIGGFLLVTMAIHFLEKTAKPESSAAVAKPVRVKLTRVDDETILIEMGFFNKSRYRFNNSDSKEEIDALYNCLEEGIAREFGANAERRRISSRARMKEVQDRCRQTADSLLGGLPEIPSLPEP